MSMTFTRFLATILLLPLVSVSVFAADGEWHHYGNDLGGSRYSPLDQITPANVGRLKQAWVYRTNPGETLKTHLQTTPLMVGDSLYLCTGTNQIIALDAETGAQR